MFGDRKTFRGSRLRLIALLVFVNASVLALTGISLDAGYRQYKERAAVTSRNTNRLVSQAIAGDIGHIDLALRTAADETARLHGMGGGGAADGLGVFLDRLLSRLPMADSLRFVDRSGALAAGSGEPPPRIAMGDRDYFRRLRDDPHAGLVISEPIQGRVTGKWILIFARRVEAADGTFLGAVLAPVTIAWFEARFNDLEVGPNGTVVMRGNAERNFDLLARFPHAGYVGQTKVSDTFRARITADPVGGTYEAEAGADGVRRTFSYQAIGGYPLITLVGMATQDYLGEWRRDAIKLLLMTAAFSVVSAAAGFGLLRSWRRLEHRSEELARSNADLEQFAYVASHDLQTPLRNIAGYAQLLARRYKGRLDPDADEFIDFIVGGAKNLAVMIPDLLEYARVSRSPPEPEPVALETVMASVLINLGPDLKEAGAELKIDPMPTVMGEPRQLESLFQNLISNALTYRRDDEAPRIAVTARRHGRDQWLLSVEDNGIGIDPAYFEKIFIIFQRLDPARHPGGTGIGLALCRRIVTRFGGEIWVESEPGRGTAFRFTLRAAPEA